jgi:CBS domain-containing protein
MKITAQQYISNGKDDNSYVTIFKHFYGSTEKKVNKQGDIYTLISMEAEKNVSLERVSKFVWDSIVDGYLYSNSETTNESLKDSIEQGVKKVKDLMTNNKELGEKGINVSFVIVLVKEEGIYVGVFGENDIYAYKKGEILNISGILSEKKANTAGITLDPNDLLMISTDGLLEKSESRLSVLKKKEEFVKTLDAIGDNLNGTKALLYLAEDIEGKIVEKKKKPVLSIPLIKDGAEKLLKPMARVEKIKEEPEKVISKLQELIEKLKIKEIFTKFKIVGERVWSKVLVVLKKVGQVVNDNWVFLKQKIAENLGKKRWYKRIAAKISEVRVVRKRPVGVAGMRIDNYKVRDLRTRRFKIFLMFVLIIVLLTLGVNFTVKMKHSREISKIANESFVKVEDLLKKSSDNFVTDRISSETYLFQAEKILKEIPSELNEKDSQKHLELEERVLEIGDSFYKRVGISDKNGKLTNFLDSRLSFGEGSITVDMALYIDSVGSEFVIVADKGRKAVYRVSLYDKSVKALPDNEGYIKEPAYVYIGTKGVYVYDLKEGMLKASFDEDGWFTAFSPLSGLGVGDVRATDIAGMTVWTSLDNVYLLSRDRKSLLKSTSSYGDRYGLSYTFISDDAIEKATDVIADLSIYFVIPEDPHILRFNYSYLESKYVQAPLGVLGFDGNYGKLTKAYTGDSLEYGLYLFDSSGKRFLKFEKPIEAGKDMRHPNEISLLSQYVYRGEKDSVLSDVKNFVVDSKEVNMYILDGSVIWKLGL